MEHRDVRGPDHPALARPLGIPASSLAKRGRFAGRDPDSNRPDRIEFLGHLAWIVGATGHRRESDEMAGRAPALTEEFPGEGREDLIRALGPRPPGPRAAVNAAGWTGSGLVGLA